jgi:hypothetical protein
VATLIAAAGAGVSLQPSSAAYLAWEMAAVSSVDCTLVVLRFRLDLHAGRSSLHRISAALCHFRYDSNEHFRASLYRALLDMRDLND